MARPRLPGVFWWLWTGLLINAIGAFTLPFLAFFLARSLHLRAAAIGAILAVFGVGSLLAAFNAGWITDRFGRRPVLLVSQLATAVGTAGFAFVREPVAFAVLVGVFGIAINVPNPVLRALVADVVPSAERASAYAAVGWASGLGAVSAPALGGLIASQGGFRMLFLVDAATTVAYAAITFLRVPETGVRGGAERIGRPVLLADRALLYVVLLNALFALVFFQGQSTLPIVLARHGLHAGSYGLVFATGTAVTLALQLPVARLLGRWAPHVVIAAGALLTGLGFGLTALAHGRAEYAATVAIWSLGALAVTPFTSALVSDLAPEHARGRYQGAYQLSWSGNRLIAPPLGTLTLQHAGESVLWGACGVIGALVAVGHLAAGAARRR